MSEPLVSIFTGADIVQLPFAVFSSTTQLITLTYGDLERAQDEVRRIYCVQGIAANLPPRIKAPILFTLIGQISPINCYLTQRGWHQSDTDMGADASDSESDGAQPAIGVASFWFEQRPNDVSALSWIGVGKTIRAITERFDRPHLVDTSRLYDLGDELDGKCRMQFIWYGHSGESTDNRIRMYDSNGVREETPRSLHEVPFQQPYEVVFTLQYTERRDGSILMYACPLRMYRV